MTSPPAGEGGQDVSSAGGLPGVLPAVEGVVFFTSDVGVAMTAAVGESSNAGGAGVIRGSACVGAGEPAVVEELGEGAGWGWGGVGVTPSGLLSVGVKKKKSYSTVVHMRTREKLHVTSKLAYSKVILLTQTLVSVPVLKHLRIQYSNVCIPVYPYASATTIF